MSRILRDRGLDALLVGGGPGSADICYLTNYRPYSPAWVLLPQGGEPVVLHHFYNHNACARAMTAVGDVRWYGPSAPAAVAQCLRDLHLDRSAVGVVGLANAIPYGHFTALRAAVPETRFEDVGGSFRWLRWVRSEEEIGWLRRSAALGDAACEALAAGIRPGMTEREVAVLLEQAALPAGGRVALAFLASTPMDAPERGVPWQYPTDRVLQPGDAVITELTVDFWTYGAQLHRPFAVGRPPTPLYQALFDAALACFERILGVLRPGATSEDIVTAAAVVEERGFTTCDSVFHGEAGKSPELGTPSAVHPLEPFTLRENMLVVIQPNPTTHDRRAGLQLGGAAIVRAHGPELLHRYPLRFTVCGA